MQRSLEIYAANRSLVGARKPPTSKLATCKWRLSTAVTRGPHDPEPLASMVVLPKSLRQRPGLATLARQDIAAKAAFWTCRTRLGGIRSWCTTSFQVSVLHFVLHTVGVQVLSFSGLPIIDIATSVVVSGGGSHRNRSRGKACLWAANRAAFVFEKPKIPSSCIHIRIETQVTSAAVLHRIPSIIV